MNKIINDDISFVKKTYPNHCKKIHILMTHATNPLLKNKTINKAFNYYKNKLYNNKCDSVFTVNSYQTRFYKKNMKPINHDPKKLIKTQNLKKIYEENSCLYFFSIKSFLKSKNRIGTKAKMYITPFEESIDIDDLQTWKIAKKFFNH